MADLDGDGRPEVMGSGYSIFSLDGATGALKWRVAAGKDRSIAFQRNDWRTYPGIIVADLDGDGQLEIVTGHDGGFISVYDAHGYFKPGWPKRPTTYEIFGLAAYDLDNDNRLEIVATADVRDPINTWVYEPDGTPRAGWPQWVGGDNYAYGTFNDNVAVGDVDGDGRGDIVVPSDINNIAAYHDDGRHLVANSIFRVPVWVWGMVNHWEAYSVEINGGGHCKTSEPRSQRNVGNFERGAAVIADVDGDGVAEVVSSGEVYDCAVTDRRPSLYEGIYLFNADRTRFNRGGYDWRAPPLDTGAPLSEDFDVIRNIRPNPVVVDLDGDGKREIIYPTFDGRLHAFWLDKTEHYNWPYSVYRASEGVYRFASEPVVADLNHDGHPEVIFTSWPEARSNLVGHLYILDYQGNLLHKTQLPDSWSTRPPDDWNGGLAAPTLADIDADADLEVVINTAHAGLVAYDLPGTANARVDWGTGRANYRRTGSLPLSTSRPGSLASSTKTVAPATARSGQVLTYTLRLVNSGQLLSGVRLTDVLPSALQIVGSPTATSGEWTLAAPAGCPTCTSILWHGSVPAQGTVTVRFQARVGSGVNRAQAIANVVQIDDGAGRVLERQATVVANGLRVHLPVVTRAR